VNLRFIDWIWHVRGQLVLVPTQSSDEAFDRLTPLFLASGTSHERTNDTLTFRKKDQAAQDKMSVFDGGALTIERSGAEPVLRYDLISRALLFCFLAPLLFLAIAGATIVIARYDHPPAEEAKKKDKKKDEVQQMNPIDKFLGAPAPEKPKKNKTAAEKKADEDKKKPSPTSAYVFAGIFAALYVIGRILEDRLIKGLFRKRLLGS
jgi:hypothetical protein